MGRFPAESPTVSGSRAYALHLICYNKNADLHDISFVRPSTTRGEFSDPLFIGVSRPLSDDEIERVERSRGLYYSWTLKRIYSIDFLDAAEAGLVRNVTAKHPSPAVQSFLAHSFHFAPPCNVPLIDRGVTEAYWATKGTLVLHHWAYLYDSAVWDGRAVHAQYGYFVSNISRQLERIAGKPGPTSFVRVAWIVYAVIGLAYIAAFFFVFSDAPLVALAALVYKIYVFTLLTPFSILLSPGYHWSRELILLGPALFARRAPKRNVFWLAPVIAALSYVLDPTFFFFAVACAVAASLLSYHVEILAHIRDFGKWSILAGALVGGAAIFAISRDWSNLAYAVDSVTLLGTYFHIAFLYLGVIALNAALALTALILVWLRKLDARSAYFAFVSLAMLGYYLITADEFHFKKYIEYCVPFYASLAAAAVMLLRDARFKNVTAARYGASAAMVVLACTFAARSVMATMSIPEPWGWQLRIFDSKGRAYFSSSTSEINGRAIDANLNARTVAHLRTFPSRTNYDYIISPLDKYLLFLYDAHNGFSSVDFIASLSSYPQVWSVERRILERHGTVVIDRDLDVVHPGAAILGNNFVMGNINDMSALSVQSRLRASELASLLRTRCPALANEGNTAWSVVRC